MEEKKEQLDTEGEVAKAGKEFYWILGVMVGLILIFLVASAVFQDLKNIEYGGLTFTKERFGSVDFYQYYFYTEGKFGVLDQYYLNLRIDPRKNDVPVSGKIVFPEWENVYVSINETGLDLCSESRPALATLASFFQGNKKTIRTGTPDRAEAEEEGIQYITCESLPSKYVLLIREGNETKIEVENSCYVISINDCQAFPAIEKYVVEALVDLRSSEEVSF